MFRNSAFQRTICTAVLVTFTNLIMTPVAHATGYGGVRQVHVASAVQPGDASVEARAASLLEEIHGHLKAVAPGTAFAKGTPAAVRARAPGLDVAARAHSIRALHQELRGLYDSIEKGFSANEARLRASGMPQVLLDRQQTAVTQYRARKDEFERLVGAVEAAADDSSEQRDALEQLGAFMARYQTGRHYQYTNPNHMPFGFSERKVREPFLSTQEFQMQEFQDSLFRSQDPKTPLAEPVPAGTSFSQAALPATPNAADLAETEDVQLTQAIRDQAAALEKNPVKIYNWVRNNIQFIPSYGSLQGSDMTLSNRRGNAFDTASLLIALYRASGIPARYVYGTIELPAAKAMNWVGGVTKAEAAQSLLGQGGIPNVALVAGGMIQAIRMEHVWVQAYVDASPSRGAVNRRASSWLPMDPSFKQYTFTKGMDIAAHVPAPTADMVAAAQQGATIDEAQGYVQNLNRAQIRAHVASYEAQVNSYIASIKPNATIGDVLGKQTVIPEQFGLLPATLPYKTLATAGTFQTLPDNLRWRFKTNIYPADGLSDADSPLIEVNRSTPALAGKKITLSFTPASDADRNLIASYLPKPHADGSPIQPNELPSTLPGYLLNMKAELRVDGQMAAQTAGSFTMGSTVRQANAYFNPSTGQWEGGEDNDLTVGEYNGIGIDLQGVTQEQLTAVKARIEANSAKLAAFQANPNNSAVLNGMTREDFGGDVVYSGILGYFAQVDTQDNLIAATFGNVRTYRAPSYGRFFTGADARYFFGIVRSVSFTGAGMDVDYLRYHVASLDDSTPVRAQFMRRAGASGSASEHSVPEAIFRNLNLAVNDPAQPQGISAVKALAMAAAQGQKVYTLNPSNASIHSAVLQSLSISEDSKSEIAHALSVGREVTVHEADISLNGWTGSGYVILDQDSGSGAYKINGGSNGAYIKGLMFGVIVALVMVDIILGVMAGGVAGVLLMGAVAAIALTVAASVTKMVKNMSDEERACFWNGFGTAFSIASFPLGYVVGGPAGAAVFGLLGVVVDVFVNDRIDDTPGVVCRKG